jgi:hypothetical protein
MEALDALHSPQRRPTVRVIPADLVEELNFRFYLSQLDPPMTVRQSAQFVYRYANFRGELVTQDDASRREAAKSLMPRTRDFLRIAIDMRLLNAEGLG